MVMLRDPLGRGEIDAVGQGDAEQTIASPNGRENDAVTELGMFPIPNVAIRVDGNEPEKMQFSTSNLTATRPPISKSGPVLPWNMHERAIIP
jgi:hypothetical protein